MVEATVVGIPLSAVDFGLTDFGVRVMTATMSLRRREGSLFQQNGLRIARVCINLIGPS